MLSTIALAITLAFFSGFVATVLTVPLVMSFAKRCGIVDRPGARRIHKDIIPRAGGLAVFFGTHAAAAILFYSLYIQPLSAEAAIDREWWLIFFLASAFVTLVGLIDDYQNLRPLTKLCGQTVGALLMVLAGIRVESMFGWELPLLLSVGVTICWFLFATNIFNLIDGLDGLATGLAAIASLGLAGSLVHREMYFEALLITGFIGAAVGFFRFNRHPAKVFLGDTGSNFIGFFLAALSLETGSKSSAFGYLAVAFLALGVPIFDTLLAVWRRSNRLALSYLRRTERPGGIMAGDLEHLHHRLLRGGLSQRDVVAFLHLANAVLVLIGLVALPYQGQAFGILLLTCALAVFVIARFVPMVEMHDTVLAIIHALAYPTARVAVFFARMCLDACIIAISLVAVTSLLRSALFLGWFYSIFVWGTFPFVALTFAEIVSIKARMPRMVRLRFLSSCFFFGTLLSFAFVLFWHPEMALEIAVQSGVFALLAYAGLMGLRIFWETLAEAAGEREEKVVEEKARKKAAESRKLKLLR